VGRFFETQCRCLSQWHGWTAAFSERKNLLWRWPRRVVASISWQPSITDACRGGRDSLLVEAICWLDVKLYIIYGFGWMLSHSALTSRLGLRLQWGSLTLIWLRVPIVLYCGSLTGEYFGFQDLIVANRGEDRSFHVMEGSVPIWTSGLVR